MSSGADAAFGLSCVIKKPGVCIYECIFASMFCVQALLIKAQLQLAGHSVRMEDYRIPEGLFNGQLTVCKRRIEGTCLYYKDTLKCNLTECCMSLST